MILFFFEEYKQALEGVCPNARECIMLRAARDPDLEVDQYRVLVELADKMEGMRDGAVRLHKHV